MLTQKPARARYLETRRKVTNVEAKRISAIIVPTILSPWSAYRLNPGRWTIDGGGPEPPDDESMVGLMKMVEFDGPREECYMLLSRALCPRQNSAWEVESGRVEQ